MFVVDCVLFSVFLLFQVICWWRLILYCLSFKSGCACIVYQNPVVLELHSMLFSMPLSLVIVGHVDSFGFSDYRTMVLISVTFLAHLTLDDLGIFRLKRMPQWSGVWFWLWLQRRL